MDIVETFLKLRNDTFEEVKTEFKFGKDIDSVENPLLVRAMIFEMMERYAARCVNKCVTPTAAKFPAKNPEQLPKN